VAIKLLIGNLPKLVIYLSLKLCPKKIGARQGMRKTKTIQTYRVPGEALALIHQRHLGTVALQCKVDACHGHMLWLQLQYHRVVMEILKTILR
jgi:hypothetical protein